MLFLYWNRSIVKLIYFLCKIPTTVVKGYVNVNLGHSYETHAWLPIRQIWSGFLISTKLFLIILNPLLLYTHKYLFFHCSACNSSKNININKHVLIIFSNFNWAFFIELNMIFFGHLSAFLEICILINILTALHWWLLFVFLWLVLQHLHMNIQVL